MSVDPRTLMVGMKQIEGFWLSEWLRLQNPLRLLRLFRQVRRLVSAGVLTSDFRGEFALEDIKQAVEQASTPGHHGKVLLRIG
jgi:hypothetical protein